ncbi:MAG: fumarate reductase flavoprotein subunit [Campylobacterota bacterium]|nr:fumarate reductase flavoprotein subunit [Campylobacterota bacterium]
MKIYYCDALIIGGGLAGLRSAVAASQKDLNVTVLSMVPVKRSHSAAAQGGMQASLGNSKMSQGDNEDLHFSDTVKGSDWGCDQEVARMFVTTAPKAVRELASWGTPWTRIKEGTRTAIINEEKVKITENSDVHGLIHSRDFGGTKKWRTCYSSDATGHSMLFSVANEAIKRDVNIEDRKEAISLIHKDDRCYGAVVRDLVTGELSAYVAKGTMIATGGYGRLYRTTTNAVICEGIGQAMALETGKVPLGNMEAVQFHPTPIVPSCILLTEGCRGDGGVLRDKDGHRFMPDYEPEKKELASRDVVSRRMMEHIRNGKGVEEGGSSYVWLDISILGREHIEKNLRDVQDIAITFNGIDPADEGKKGWLPVHPAQHYSMGGIRTDRKGHTQLKGLFSAGEAACWDLHGFNRLGGNSVSEAVVSGMIVGNYFADYCRESDIAISTNYVQDAILKQDLELDRLLTLDGPEDIFKIKARMQEIMDTKVGVFRNGVELDDAVVLLEELMEKVNRITVKAKNKIHNDELTEAYRVPKMLKLAMCVAVGARDRTESRGAHYREDYLKRNDEQWLKRTLAYWKDEKDVRPEIKYEPLDINTMEMPPGFRGYGEKGNIIEHPDSAKRQNIVDNIREKMTKEGKNRIEIQDAIMPYVLRREYKAINYRVGDRI